MFKRLLFLLLFISVAFGQNATDLFISEYVEGSGYNKYIEIFNGTGSTVDLTDYQLQLFSNGSTTPKTLNLSGTLDNNQVAVYKHSNAAIYSGSATSSSLVINFNGDDAVALVKNGNYVDIIGSIGQDPGSYWSVSGNKTQNKTLVRNSNVSAGVTTNTSGFPTLGTEWTMMNENTHSLGSHQFDGGSTSSGDLFISEYVEGSSYNKYIEIFNGTGSTVDLSDYQLQLFSNGSMTPKTLNLSGMLDNNQVAVFKHSNAAVYSGSATSSSLVINFNGDDAVALLKNGNYIDIFGTIGEDPGSYWSVSGNKTQNKTLVRNPDVTTGVTANDSGFPTLGTEWTMMDQNTHTLGTHEVESGAEDLFISEYVEGSSYNKYIEIFNGTGNSVDLSNYQLQLFTNGSTTPKTLNLSGTLDNNQVAVYKHSSAAIYSGSATSSNLVINFNGDDAVALVKNGEYVDIFGSIGEDPGSYWSVSGNKTQNKTLVRNSNVSAGVKVNSSGFPTLGTEWTMMNENTHSLGSHQFGGGSSINAPVASNATNISGSGFTANWSAVGGAANYFLDVSASSSFSGFVTGYENKNVGNVTSYSVSGLSSGTTYYFRVRVETGQGTSSSSNVISVQTTGNMPTTVSFTKLNALVQESGTQSTFEVKIMNPSSATATTANIVLIKGSASEIGNFQTQTITFPAGSATSKYLTFTTTNNSTPEALKYFSFQLQNVSGGNSAAASGNDKLHITLVDDDWKNNSIYNSANSLSGDQLKSELNNLVDGHTEYPYTSSSTDTWDVLKVSDQDPTDTTKVHLIYTGFQVDKNGHSSSQWNREHVWAKSHGDFGTTLGAGTDLHHLRPANPSVNSSRSNKDFDNGGTPHSIATGCKSDSDSWEPRDEMKGDVARMIFYMAVRYEGQNGDPDLELYTGVDSAPNKEPLHGNLPVLLEWNRQDPPDAFERRRNEIVYQYQGNRNPFIDNPAFVDSVWDSNSSKAVNTDEIIESFLEQNYPNPFNPVTQITIGVAEEGRVKLEVFNILGQKVKTIVNKELPAGEHKFEFDGSNLASGVYFYVFKANGVRKTKKMVLAK